MDVELRDIQYFAVVAEHGNLGRAAEALGMSQPAISKSLRRLEKWARMKVVRRTPKGVELTAVGAALLTHARRLHLSLDDLNHEVADLRSGQSGHLRAGADIFASDHLMPKACAAFLKDAPNATMTIAIGAIDTLLSALRKGEVDLIVSTIPGSSNEDVVRELFHQEFAVYASAGHRLARAKQVTIHDIAHERWAIPGENVLSWQHVLRAFSDHYLPPPRIGLDTASILIKFQAVASSDLVGFTGTRVLRQAASKLPLVDLRVKELAWSVRVGIRFRKNAYLSPAAHRFVGILETISRELVVDPET